MQSLGIRACDNVHKLIMTIPQGTPDPRVFMLFQITAGENGLLASREAGLTAPFLFASSQQ